MQRPDRLRVTVIEFCGGSSSVSQLQVGALRASTRREESTLPDDLWARTSAGRSEIALGGSDLIRTTAGRPNLGYLAFYAPRLSFSPVVSAGDTEQASDRLPEAARPMSTLLWTSLSEFARRLASARRMHEISRLVIQEVRKHVAADGVSFVLRDDETCYYIDDEAILPLWRGLKFPTSSCISGWCMTNDKVAFIPDVYQDDRIPLDVYRATFVKSMIMLPIGSPEPFAAMGIYWAAHRPIVDEETLSILHFIASLAASAITSVHLYTFLLQSENKLALADETGALGSFELNTRTCKLVSSTRTKQIFGYSLKNDVSYAELVDTFYRGDRERFIGAVVGSASSGKHFSLDCKILRSDASVHSIRVLGRVSVVDHDPDIYILGAVRHVKAHTNAIGG